MDEVIQRQNLDWVVATDGSRQNTDDNGGEARGDSDGEHKKGPAGGGIALYRVQDDGKSKSLVYQCALPLGIEKTSYDSEVITTTMA